MKRKLYDVHKQIGYRCYKETHKDYPRYGGRGIFLCEEWQSFENFYNWSSLSGYKPGLTIERKDNDGPYSPENCTWIPNEHQAKNRSSNHWLEMDGKRMTVSEWSKSTGIHYRTIMSRLRYGWPIERVLG